MNLPIPNDLVTTFMNHERQPLPTVHPSTLPLQLRKCSPQGLELKHMIHTIQSKQTNGPQAQGKARTGHTSNHSQEGHFITWTWSCCRSPFTQTHSHAGSLGHLLDPQPGPSFTEIHPWTPKLHPKLVLWIGFSDTFNQENHRGTFYSTFCSTEPHWHELQNSLFWK